MILARSQGTGRSRAAGADLARKGVRKVSETQHRPAVASYLDAVEELVGAGESFGDIEGAIDEVADLTMDQKAALWLFAFSLRDQPEQQRDARAHLAAVQ